MAKDSDYEEMSQEDQERLREHERQRAELADDLALAQQEEEDAQAVEVERAAFEQEAAQLTPEQQAERRRQWEEVVAASTAASAAVNEPPPGATVVDCPPAAPPPPAMTAHKLVAITGEDEEVPAPLVLEDRYNRMTWPDVTAPARLFDLVLGAGDDPECMYPTEIATGSPTFFDVYLRVFGSSTDAPVPFHLATAMTVLSTAMGRTWSVEQRGKLFANLWIMLIADSGARKSTAMGACKQLLEDVNLMIGPAASTAKFLVDVYEKDVDGYGARFLWYIDEAVGFIDTVTKNSHTQELAPHLTTLFDGGKIERSTVKNTLLGPITNPYVSLLTGGPLAWLRDRRLNDDFLRGGVFGRMLMVPAARTEFKVNPPAVNERKLAALKQWLAGVHDQGGHVPLSHDALQLFGAWLLNTPMCPELDTTGVWLRRGNYVLKLALIYHVACFRPATQPIQLDCMKWAINFTHYYLLPGQLWCASRLSDRGQVIRVMTDIEDALDSTPEGLEYTAMCKQFGATLDQLRKYLWSLWQSKRIEWWYWRADPFGRGAARWLVSRFGVSITGRPGKVQRSGVAPLGVINYGKMQGERAFAVNSERFTPPIVLEDKDPATGEYRSATFVDEDPEMLVGEDDDDDL